MKHRFVLILVGAVVVSGMASCGPTAPSPTPSDASLPPNMTAPVVPTKPAPTNTAAQLPTAMPTPTAVTRLLTVVAIPQTEPSIGKDKSNMSGVPIPTPLDPALEKIVLQAKEDLAKRSAINVDQISLVEVQSVTWPDGSLGCPQPGMAYIQVQVDGLLIRLSASGNVYEYHSGGTRAPFLCKPSP